jgi:hypothetical protein
MTKKLGAPTAGKTFKICRGKAFVGGKAPQSSDKANKA